MPCFHSGAMNAGIYRSTTGLLHQEARLQAIAENLANSSMPGYKRTVTSANPFVGTLQKAMTGERPEDGVRLARVAIDFSQGPMRTTGRALDFAIEGDAFFVITRDGKEYYTRDGAFAVDRDGNLVTASGAVVAGDINIPAETVVENLTLDPDGTLRDGKNALGTIRLASFPDLQRLRRAGAGLFTAPNDMPPEEPGASVKVHNRMLEHSNACAVLEMTDLIACMRNFEACQKMIGIQDKLDSATIAQAI